MGTEGKDMGKAISVGQNAGKCPRRPRIGQPVAQVRGVLAEQVVISIPLDPFLSLRALASYSGLSVRKLREYLTDPAHPLPCYRVGARSWCAEASSMPG